MPQTDIVALYERNNLSKSGAKLPVRELTSTHCIKTNRNWYISTKDSRRRKRKLPPDNYAAEGPFFDTAKP